MRQAPTERRKLDFSIATINVIFLLLLFFILSGTIVEQSETGIDPAQTRTLPVERLPRPLLVLRGADDIVLEGRPVRRSGLPAALAAVRGSIERKDPRIFILASGDLASSVLLDVIASIKGRGFAISLVTLRTGAGSER